MIGFARIFLPGTAKPQKFLQSYTSLIALQLTFELELQEHRTINADTK